MILCSCAAGCKILCFTDDDCGTMDFCVNHKCYSQGKLTFVSQDSFY